MNTPEPTVEEVLNVEIKELEVEIDIYEQIVPLNYTQEDWATMARLKPLREAKKALSYRKTLQAVLAIPEKTKPHGVVYDVFDEIRVQTYNAALSVVREAIEREMK